MNCSPIVHLVWTMAQQEAHILLLYSAARLMASMHAMFENMTRMSSDTRNEAMTLLKREGV